MRQDPTLQIISIIILGAYALPIILINNIYGQLTDMEDYVIMLERRVDALENTIQPY